MSVFVIASAIVLSSRFLTPEQRLRRELAAYVHSVVAQDPRPDLVQSISSNSVPILLKWLSQTEFQPTTHDQFAALLLRLTFGRLDLTSSRDYVEFPSTLASFGFDFLGTNAASAVPALAELARAPKAEDARDALIAIGAPSLSAAEMFSHERDPNIRFLGAWLVARIGENHDRSVEILIPLLDDPDADVRSEAYGAMAEFPGPDTEQILIPRLPDLARDLSENPMHAPTAAYALHTGSTNALVHLVDACIQSTNHHVRALLLAALAARDDQHNPRKDDLRNYGARRGNYWRYLEQYKTHPPEPDLNPRLHLIRSNILATGLPHVEKVLTTTNSPTGRPPQNPLQSSR